MIMSTQSIFFIVWSSDISIWPGFEQLSKEKILSHKCENSYDISSSKQHQNRRYCHQTDDYRRWLCVGLLRR